MKVKIKLTTWIYCIERLMIKRIPTFEWQSVYFLKTFNHRILILQKSKVLEHVLMYNFLNSKFNSMHEYST